MAILQVFTSALRWREISGFCGAPLTTEQAFRFNAIGTFFNQTLPSSIGGYGIRLWLVGRGTAGWRAVTYSVVVDRGCSPFGNEVLQRTFSRSRSFTRFA